MLHRNINDEDRIFPIVIDPPIVVSLEDYNGNGDGIMKNITVIITIAIVFLIAVMSFLYYSHINRVNILFVNNGEARYIYGEKNNIKQIKQKDVENIIKILNGKIMYKDNPSCGFSENIAVIFNKTDTFCFARDTCPIVYWKEKGKYITLTYKEQKQLYDILKTYGFQFPCT